MKDDEISREEIVALCLNRIRERTEQRADAHLAADMMLDLVDNLRRVIDNQYEDVKFLLDERVRLMGGNPAEAAANFATLVDARCSEFWSFIILAGWLRFIEADKKLSENPRKLF